MIETVLVTGGAGYVGSVLVPSLIEAGYNVKVLDLYLYRGFFNHHPRLRQIRGDIRNNGLLEVAVSGCDAIIHLACISNDPSFELNPELGKSINYDAFLSLMDVTRNSDVQRFIFASSASVYGVKDEENVTEDLLLEPLTDYSKYKAMCEDVLLNETGFTRLILRPATICGYSPRMRLDLTVNILTNHAVNNRKITVFSGQQMRPNIHIKDMVDLYVRSLQYFGRVIDGKIFNVGFENYKVSEIAEIVRSVVGEDIEIITTPSDDNRSYRVSSEKISRELGFVPAYTTAQAARDLVSAFQEGEIPNSMTDDKYYNIRTMKRWLCE